MSDCKHGQPDWAACPKCIDESVDRAYERIAELEAELSHAWETCQKAVERGMKLEAELAELREAFRWKKMDEEFPEKPTHLEIVYENNNGHQWCEVHKCREPKGDWLGLCRPVLWRELHHTPPKELQNDKHS